MAKIIDFHLLVKLEKEGEKLEYTNVVTYNPFANVPDWMRIGGGEGEILTTRLTPLCSKPPGPTWPAGYLPPWQLKEEQLEDDEEFARQYSEPLLIPIGRLAVTAKTQLPAPNGRSVLEMVKKWVDSELPRLRSETREMTFSDSVFAED